MSGRVLVLALERLGTADVDELQHTHDYKNRYILNKLEKNATRPSWFLITSGGSIVPILSPCKCTNRKIC